MVSDTHCSMTAAMSQGGVLTYSDKFSSQLQIDHLADNKMVKDSFASSACVSHFQETVNNNSETTTSFLVSKIRLLESVIHSDCFKIDLFFLSSMNLEN